MTGIERTDGRTRAVIEAVTPQVDGGRFAVKRSVGEILVVEADCFADGHDVVLAQLLWRPESEGGWRELSMAPLRNDRWRGALRFEAVGMYRYTVRAWVDAFASWRRDFARREDPEDLRTAARTGATLIAEAAKRAGGEDRARLEAWASALGDAAPGGRGLRELGLDTALGALAQAHVEPRFPVTHPELALVVEPERARFSAWYEFFPRSTSPAPGRHGTLREPKPAAAMSPRWGSTCCTCRRSIRSGARTARARTTRCTPAPDDPGSPWAIGAADGGHTRVHPELGTLEDFARLVATARDARDRDRARHRVPVLARSSVRRASIRSGSHAVPTAACSTPRIRRRSTRTSIRSISSATDWRGAVAASSRDVVEFWIAQGVRVFRVDNPHTKPFALLGMAASPT